MPNHQTLITGAFVLTFMMLAIGAVFSYLLVYLSVKGRKPTEGRLLSIEVQFETIFVGCMILAVSLIPPLAVGGDEYGLCLFYQCLGGVLLEAAGFMRASIKFSNSTRQKYSYWVNNAFLLGTGVLCASGTIRLLGYKGSFIFETLLVILAIAILLATEVWFLRRNSGCFLPRCPR